MKVLIAFWTSEGHTRKVARHIARVIEAAGSELSSELRHVVDLHDCSQIDAGLDITQYDAVILAASVHHARYQPGLYEFVATHLTGLRATPTAFVSVSLAVTLADGEAEARSYVDDFFAETGWRTDAVHLAEGAIRYLEYSRSEAQTIELVVFKSQKKMPAPGSNPEYTDWDALAAFTTGFLEKAA